MFGYCCVAFRVTIGDLCVFCFCCGYVIGLLVYFAVCLLLVF